jgi:hypothetical protein
MVLQIFDVCVNVKIDEGSDMKTRTSPAAGSMLPLTGMDDTRHFTVGPNKMTARSFREGVLKRPNPG